METYRPWLIIARRIGELITRCGPRGLIRKPKCQIPDAHEGHRLFLTDEGMARNPPIPCQPCTVEQLLRK
jgi:hypothetical protein